MSERKGINKYYPPDWDPSKVPKKKKLKNQTIKVRIEAPYSMRCLKCNEYIGVGRKFNAKKETTNERYLNIKIIRIHISCPVCSNPITYKTSPQTAGYVPESGAERNYVPNNPVAKIPTNRQETEEEILKRLEKEDEENKSYQLQKVKRKNNPFWKQSESLKDGNGNVMETLQQRLEEQQRQQQITEDLERTREKKLKLERQGGADVLLSKAYQELERKKNNEPSEKSEELFQQKKTKDTQDKDQLFKSVIPKSKIIKTRKIHKTQHSVSFDNKTQLGVAEKKAGDLIGDYSSGDE